RGTTRAATALGPRVRRAAALLRLPVVADLLVRALEGGVRDAVGALGVVVLLGGGVVRLGERPLRLRARAAERRGQLGVLGRAGAGGLRHRAPPSGPAGGRGGDRPGPAGSPSACALRGRGASGGDPQRPTYSQCHGSSGPEPPGPIAGGWRQPYA